jgi:hypothetical protein
MFSLYRATIKGLTVEVDTAQYTFISSSNIDIIFKIQSTREFSEVFAYISLLMDSTIYRYSGVCWGCYLYVDLMQNTTDVTLLLHSLSIHCCSVWCGVLCW